MKPLRVLYVSNDSALSGAPCSLLDLLLKLNRRLFFPIVVCPREGALTEILHTNKIEVRVIPVILKIYQKTDNLILSILFLVRRILLNILVSSYLLRLIKKERVSLIHLNSSSVRFAGLASKISGVPIVWHIREYHESKIKQWITSNYIRTIADKIIVNSKMLRNIFVGNSVVIYNGVDLEKFPYTPLNKSKSHIIGFVGQIYPPKGVEDLIYAVKEIIKGFPYLECLIVGVNPYNYPDYVKKLNKLIACQNLSKHFIFLGYQKDITKYIKRMRVLVLPSHRESFGRVLIEAMAIGRPIVATRVGGIPEVVIDGETGILVPSRSPKVLAKAILELLENENKAEKMGEAGRARVELDFRIDRYVQQIEEVYRNLLA